MYINKYLFRDGEPNGRGIEESHRGVLATRFLTIRSVADIVSLYLPFLRGTSNYLPRLMPFDAKLKPMHPHKQVPQRKVGVGYTDL